MCGALLLYKCERKGHEQKNEECVESYPKYVYSIKLSSGVEKRDVLAHSCQVEQVIDIGQKEQV